MRQITAAALAAIRNNYGEEPITIIEIQWAADGPAKSYADKTVAGIPGKIVELGNLDSILDVTRSNTSQSINFVIEDTDATVKNIIDTQDIHHVPVRVFQYFTGLDVDVDKFLVFSGRINAPFVWSESTRTLRFDVLSEIENLEFGFSPEEGEIPGLPANLVGRPWPSIFGTAIDVPAVNIGQTVTGTTLCGVGTFTGRSLYTGAPIGGNDCSFGMSLSVGLAQIGHLNVVAAAWSSVDAGKAEQFRSQRDSILQQIQTSGNQRAVQRICAQRERDGRLAEAEEAGEGCNPLRVLGGEDFPQGRVITLSVGELLLTGVMNGQDFDIHTREVVDERMDEDPQGLRFGSSDQLCNPGPPPTFFDFVTDLPPSTRIGRQRGPAKANGQPGDFGTESTSNTHRTHGFTFCSGNTIRRRSNFAPMRNVFVESGARVSIAEGDEIAYVASITPGRVLDVRAHKQFEGEQVLVSIPRSYYTITVESYGTFDATIIRMNRTLSGRPDEGWGDDVFTTFRSDIGPNPVPIIEYITGKYTDLEVDAASFASVATDVAVTPMNFAVLDRPNTLDLLRELAFQARCASYVSEGKMFLKFLPKQPLMGDEIVTTSNVSLGSVEVTTASIEQLVTKMVATFQLSYAEDEQQIILRNNVSRYGTQEREFSFFAYNNARVVYHVATFWLIRLSNLWKRLRFAGFLDLVRLETFDTVELALPPYVASSNVLGVVNEADYNSASNEITFEVEVPVLLGTMEAHPLYWPQNSELTYPTAFDTAPGGGGLGAEASGRLPTGSLVGTPFEGIPPQTVLVGGPNAAFGSRSDRGDRTPGDVGFDPGVVVIESSFADVLDTGRPVIDLDLEFLEDADPVIFPTVPNSTATTIDIRSTPIIDSDAPGTSGVLGDFLHGISGNKLVLTTNACFADGENEGQFDFKWDVEDEEWGAGTSFFEDETE